MLTLWLKLYPWKKDITFMKSHSPLTFEVDNSWHRLHGILGASTLQHYWEAMTTRTGCVCVNANAPPLQPRNKMIINHTKSYGGDCRNPISDNHRHLSITVKTKYITICYKPYLWIVAFIHKKYNSVYVIYIINTTRSFKYCPRPEVMSTPASYIFLKGESTHRRVNTICVNICDVQLTA